MFKTSPSLSFPISKFDKILPIHPGMHQDLLGCMEESYSSCRIGRRQPVHACGGWKVWHQGWRMENKAGRDVRPVSAMLPHIRMSDGRKKAPKVPPSQTNVFLIAIPTNSTPFVRQGEKKKPEVIYFPHQQEEFWYLKWKSNFPDTKSKTDETWPSARQLPGSLWGDNRFPVCMPRASVGSIRVISTSLSTLFSIFKRYFYMSLPLPIVTLAHSSLTTYQENILWKKQGQM